MVTRPSRRGAAFGVKLHTRGSRGGAGSRRAGDQPTPLRDALQYLIMPLSTKSGVSSELSMPSATPSVLAAAVWESARAMSPPLAIDAPLALSMSDAP